ncbi:MAG: cation:proton antiporter [Rhodospirillaceae bacterium]|nr:cation:proton antiporter [Rhodospirillaceae bacterium]|tara:strand:+ start:4863 stop:5285 length:423 start_codon:yes stop_codon:yes gene_type:complete
MSEHIIVRVVVKMLVPFILLFALYVQMHGDYGPGGGFQAGVIFATGFIIYGIVFGVKRAIKAMPLVIITTMISAGLILYAMVGFVALGIGATFLDYSALDPHNPVHGQHIGIIVIELGVGITVAGVLTAIFFTFAERRSS